MPSVTTVWPSAGTSSRSTDSTTSRARNAPRSNEIGGVSTTLALRAFTASLVRGSTGSKRPLLRISVVFAR